jgi:hypothetical protein
MSHTGEGQDGIPVVSRPGAQGRLTIGRRLTTCPTLVSGEVGA